MEPIFDKKGMSMETLMEDFKERLQTGNFKNNEFENRPIKNKICIFWENRSSGFVFKEKIRDCSIEESSASSKLSNNTLIEDFKAVV